MRHIELAPVRGLIILVLLCGAKSFAAPVAPLVQSRVNLAEIKLPVEFGQIITANGAHCPSMLACPFGVSSGPIWANWHVDGSGNLLVAAGGSPVSSGALTCPSVGACPLGLTPGGAWSFLNVDSSGNLLVSLSGSTLPTLPTTPNSVPEVLTSTPAGGIGGTATWSLPGVAGRTYSGTTDAVVATDRSSWIVYTSASAGATALPSAASFGSNFVFGVKTTGAGDVTITPATSTIDGAATLVVKQGQNCTISSLDNVNYKSRCASGQITAGSNITLTPSANGVSIAAAGGTLTVNGAGSATNLSDTTPAAAANGLNVKWQVSGANASAAVQGDGTVSHCLSGTGTWVACSGGGGAKYQMLFSNPTAVLTTARWIGASGVTNSASNSGFQIPIAPASVSKIDSLYCATATAPGAGNTWVLTVAIATTLGGSAADSTSTCTLSGASGAGSVSCSDLSDNPAIVQGDGLLIHVVSSGTPASSTGTTCAIQYE